ncbi:MAG: hypothetical protein ACR2NV_03120 [Thermoleophilaceae bacterium]
MSNRVIGAILILAGLAVVIVTVFAESLGIGVSSGGIEGAPTSPAFGWKQWVGLALGLVLALAGLAALLRRPSAGPRTSH